MKLRSLMAVLSLSLLVFTVSSCDKDDDAPPAPSTITDQVVASPDLTLLESAVLRANLATTLSSPGPYTVFAPTDAAFAATGITAANISALTPAQLQTLLLYHTIPAEIFAANVPAGPNAKVVTAGGDSIFVTRNTSGVYINGINVTTADVDASNGVIHLISRVLQPPTGNIVEVAQANPSFTYLVAAVIRANLASVLSGPGIYTVFAPTNNAFIAAGFPTIASIEAADPALLAGILTYHVVPGRVFANDLTNGATPATVNGKTVTVGVTGSGATVKGITNTTASNIIGVNVMARNGVVHVIDQVLLP
jgi:uncharacterized surface protein with fasciclin (FAS1) repeats